jgi:hypothetical protein
MISGHCAWGAETAEFSGTLRALLGATAYQLEENALNPDNELNLSRGTSQFELRPDFRLQSSKFRLVFRPYLRTTSENTPRAMDEPAARLSQVTTETTTAYREAFIQWTAADYLILVYGRQNYQWGPTEAFSPSNRLFDETIAAKDLFYAEPGRELWRINLTLGKHVSLVAMAETNKGRPTELELKNGNGGHPVGVSPNSAPTAETNPTGLAKLEVNSEGGATYMGVVGGGREKGTPWIGMYGNWMATDGWHLFFDVAKEAEVGRNAPTENNGLIQFETKNAAAVLAAAGTKYDFERGDIVRLEYLVDERALNESDRELVRKSLQGSDRPVTDPAQMTLAKANAAAYLAARQVGLIDQGIYLSVTSPDFIIKDLTAVLRGSCAVADRSASSYLSLEYLVGDNGQVGISHSTTHAKLYDAFDSFIASSTTLIARYSW